VPKNDAVYATCVGTIFEKEAAVMKFRFTNLKQREKHFAKRSPGNMKFQNPGVL